MHIEGANQPIVIVHHQHAVDAQSFHLLDGLRCQAVCVNGAWVALHQVGDFCAAQVDIGSKNAAQVAVGEDAQDVLLVVNDGRHAVTFGAHFKQCVSKAAVAAHLGQSQASMHDVADTHEQSAPKLATWMGAGKVSGTEAARL